jgi:hypothetical protein
MPRYIILRHETPQGVHFDFMLEAGGALKTWSLPEPPRPGVEIECQALADHRLAYLDYEGPISGGRGTVTRWDQGTYTLERQSEGEWIAGLTGDRIAGDAVIRRADPPGQWTFSLKDSTAGPLGQDQNA